MKWHVNSTFKMTQEMSIYMDPTPGGIFSHSCKHNMLRSCFIKCVEEDKMKKTEVHFGTYTRTYEEQEQCLKDLHEFFERQ